MPLKSIARCRSVSKRWASVLRRPDFTELFFTRSLARPLLLLARLKEKEVIFFSTPQPQNLGENVSLIAADHHVSFPLDELVSVICNPSTKQSFPLPKMKKTREMADMRRFFGYDPVEKQHKALSVTMLDDNSVTNASCNSDKLPSLPPMWKGVHAREHFYFDGVTATNEFVFSPFFPSNPLHVYYYNFVKKTVTKVEIQGMGAFERRHSRVDIFLNHVADVKLM
ncbi:hypothetical protein F2Q69_00011577 [Brassica cretica]|uniref:F-box domain-containing protein n=1 Tax=Brassica cretica TaxID=69181 RepID=A0A8S9R4U7_BRACR|nr:hypothetical protein F2Q69_00011577 [Brassica cretica]